MHILHFHSQTPLLFFKNLSFPTNKEGEGLVYTINGSNRYLMSPILFYLPYSPVPYFESKYHPTPLGTMSPVEIINSSYNGLCRLV